MSKSDRRGRFSRYDEDGERIRGKQETHRQHVHEKHVRNCLRSPHLIDRLVDEEDGDY